MNSVKKTRDMVLTAAFMAIIIVMTLVPFLGYIPLGLMNATIIHIPVIIGAILLGPKKGGFLGFIFGLTSVWKATYMPNPTSFVFSPFVTIGGYTGNFWSLVVAVVPRIMVGIVAWFVFTALMKALKNKKGKEYISLACASVAGSLTNTLLVMNLIYIFFGKSYVIASEKAGQWIYGVILGIIGVYGVPEAILAGIFTTIIVKALWIAMKN